MKNNIIIALIFFTCFNLFSGVKYPYVKSPVNVAKLKYEIENSTISRALDYIEQVGDNVDIYFYDYLTDGDKALLDGIVTNHDGNALPDTADPVKIEMEAGAYPRLKWKGYTFQALASTHTFYNFAMPFDGYIQGGVFYAGESDTGDAIEFILAPDTPYEYKYVESLYLTKGAKYPIKEDMAWSALISSGTPMQIIYENLGGTKTINFTMIYRLKE